MESNDKARALDALRREHRIIEKVLGAMERFRVDPAAVAVSVWASALDFLTRFADGLHHAKEEDVLFPLLRERGMPEKGGPIACMLHDHDAGRDLRRTMGLQLPMLGRDPECAAKLAASAAEYVALMRFHIEKEDGILFHIAESLLDEPAQRMLARRFAEAAERALPAAEIASFEALADELARVASALPPGPPATVRITCAGH